MAAGCKIIKEFCRPEKDLVMRFKDMPVANIDDNMGSALDRCFQKRTGNCLLHCLQSFLIAF